MPYTAPSPLNPAHGAESTISRHHSTSHGRHNSEPSLILAGCRHNLRSPHSTSYLHRHRRSPSLHTSIPLLGRSGSQSQSHQTGGKSFGSSYTPSFQTNKSLSSPLSNNALIPTRAALSPPDSRRNSSDEEECTDKGMDEHKLSDPGAAIIFTDQSSPRRSSRNGFAGKERSASGIGYTPLDLATEVHEPRRKLIPADTPKLILPNSTDGFSLSQSSDIATHTPEDSEREDEMDLSKKPQMVRKKSGELVRPALRASKKRPLSLPGTPTFSKAVHFDSQLEYIRHFLQVDKPLAVSAGGSPAEEYDGDNEFPFGIEDTPSQSEAFEWEARIVNFPPDSDARRHLPVRLERIFLSPDYKNLVGVVAVANLAFHKHVVARFTMDEWKTTSEVVAEYDYEPGGTQSEDGYDGFNFNIGLADQANLDTKTMFICIKYRVNGLEFWDNNWSRNYEVEFSKTRPKTQKGHSSGVGSRAGHSLPRSSTPRPHSVPAFPSDIVFDSPQSYASHNELGITDSSLRLTASPSDDIVPDTPVRRNKPAPQAFGNRYDFETSLSAVMQSGSAGQTRHELPSEKTGGQLVSPSANPPKPRPEGDQVAKQAPKPLIGLSTGPPGIRGDLPGSSKPDDLASGKPGHQSPFYKELVDKYCFYESSKPASGRVVPTFSGRYINTVSANSGSPPSDSSPSSSQDSSPIRERPPTIIGFRHNSASPPAQVPGTELRTHASSAVIFPYSYHQATLMSESHTPTVIRG